MYKNMVEFNIGVRPYSVNDIDAFRDTFRMSNNKELKKMYPNDLIIECVDIRKMVETTSLKYEIERLKKVKVRLENENDQLANREKNVIKFQRNTDSGLLDIRAYNRDASNPNCYMRPIKKKAPKFAKHFFLNITLSHTYNKEVDMVINKFKRAMPTLEQGLYDVSCFVRVIGYKETSKNVVLIFPELTFNNAFFPKETKYVLMGEGGLSYVGMWCSNLFGNNDIHNAKVDVIEKENVRLLQQA